MAEFDNGDMRHISIVHKEVWDAVEQWAAAHNTKLMLCPKWPDVDYGEDDENYIPDYIFVPKDW